MAKCSTIQELTGADMEQGNALYKRYWGSSSLSVREKRENRPNLCNFRRDAVLRKIMAREMEALVSRIQQWDAPRKEQQ